MHDVVVIDDVVDKETQDLIEKSIFSAETQWTFGRTVFCHSHPEVTKEHQNTVMSFTKSLCRIDDQYEDKDLTLYASPIIEASKKFNKQLRSLMTARIQLQVPLNDPAKNGIPHVDGYRPFPYMVGVYYVNDSEGDTVIYKETIHDSTPDDIKNGNVTIDQTIPPKKGRLILFSGDIYHSSGRPRTDIRCIINYNFI
jgi:hypothetical protein